MWAWGEVEVGAWGFWVGFSWVWFFYIGFFRLGMGQRYGLGFFGLLSSLDVKIVVVVV